MEKKGRGGKTNSHVQSSPGSVSAFSFDRTLVSQNTNNDTTPGLSKNNLR